MTTTLLSLSWGTSRGRETYGYNIARLVDTSTGKRFRCTGGGYDMQGTVFGEWLQETYQPALQLLAYTGRAYGSYIGNERQPNNDRSGLYGMTVNYTPKMTSSHVTLDGAVASNPC